MGIHTNDGSQTLFNEEFGEHYHSITGAVEESKEKFVKPSKVAEKAKAGSVTILDICFGLGYNSAVAIEEILTANPNSTITIIALENDRSLFQKILDLPNINDAYKVIKKLAQTVTNENNQETTTLTITEKNVNLTLLLGDATQTITQINQPIDVVFLDPFSPKVCPQLWEKEFIQHISETMKPGATLTTYSCARIVRDNLKASNLQVEDGPKVGRRGPSTTAIKI